MKMRHTGMCTVVYLPGSKGRVRLDAARTDIPRKMSASLQDTRPCKVRRTRTVCSVQGGAVEYARNPIHVQFVSYTHRKGWPPHTCCGPSPSADADAIDFRVKRDITHERVWRTGVWAYRCWGTIESTVVVMTMHFCGSCAHTSENAVSCTAHAIQWNFVGY